MSSVKAELELIQKTFGANVYRDFMLKHGREYPIGPHSYALPRREPKACFMNATHLAIELPHLTYVEGKVMLFDIITIDHAWCVDEEGVVVDPTFAPGISDNTYDRIGGYFGVPFRTDYIEKAVRLNKLYGVLDCFYARRTAEKLFELGLDAGQAWLLDQKAIIKRKIRKVVA